MMGYQGPCMDALFQLETQMHVCFKRRQGEKAFLALVPEKVTTPPYCGFVSILWSCGISVYIILLPTPDYLRCMFSMCPEYFIAVEA